MNPLIRKTIDEAKAKKIKARVIKEALGYALGNCLSIPDDMTYKDENLKFADDREEGYFTDNFWRYINGQFGK